MQKSIIKKQPTSFAKGFGASKGFTLIETLVAIFILTLTVTGLLTLAANGYFSVRYARNQIVADNLLQESLEYMRNSRDTSALQNQTWQQWQAGFNADGCFGNDGCIVDPYASNAADQTQSCNGTCEAISFYPDSGFYGYAGVQYPASLNTTGATPSYLTTYVRTVSMQPATDPDQLIVTGTVTWLNGTAKQKTTQSILITNWHNQ